MGNETFAIDSLCHHRHAFSSSFSLHTCHNCPFLSLCSRMTTRGRREWASNAILHSTVFNCLLFLPPQNYSLPPPPPPPQLVSPEPFTSRGRGDAAEGVHGRSLPSSLLGRAKPLRHILQVRVHFKKAQSLKMGSVPFETA